MTYRWLILICLFIFVWQNASYGQEYRLSPFRVEEGLPTNYTKAVVQDHNGFIWIATDAGLIRYDGKTITQYKDLFPSNYVKSLLLKKNGTLIVGHDDGVAQVHFSKDTVTQTPLLTSEDENSPLHVFSPKTMVLFEDPDQNLWVSEPQALIRYKNGKAKRFHFEDKYLSSYFLRFFVSCNDGYESFITASQKGYLFYFDKEKEAFKLIQTPIHPGSISMVTLVRKGKILVGSSEGVFELNLNEKGDLISFEKIIPIENVSFITMVNKDYFIGTWYTSLHKVSINDGKITTIAIKGFEGKVINYIFSSPNNDLWISTDDGIMLLQKNYFSKMAFINKRPFINTMTTADNGNFYASDASSVIEFRKEGNQHSPYPFFSMPNLDIRSVTTFKDQVWIGGSQAYVFKFENGFKKKMQLNPLFGDVFYLKCDQSGNLWSIQLGLKGLTKITQEYKTLEYTKDQGIYSNLNVVREDNEGNVFCAGTGRNYYLYKYNKTEDRFENLSKPFSYNVKGTFHVQDLAFDKNNRIWLATNQGLFVDSGSYFYRIPMALNQTNTLIKAITIDKENGVWFGTDIGLHRFSKGEVSTFNEYNGLPTRIIEYRDICFDKENHLWVATSLGLARSNESLQAFEITPTPSLSWITLNDKKVSLQTNTFETNSYIQISFYCPTYPGERVSYQYRFAEKNEKWIDLETQNLITIKSLQKGNYKLEIRAKQHGEYLWSQPLVYEFNIIYPWYLRWWAITCYLVLLAAIIYVIVLLNIRRLQKEKNRLEKVIHDRTAEIYNQKEEILMQKDALEGKSKALEFALNENNIQKEKLEVLNATKDRFFSIVAHDIRGPLGTLSGFTDILANHSGSMDEKEIIFVAKDLDKSVKNTLELTENLLTWARSQMNKVSFTPQPTDLNKAVESNLNLLQATARNKGIVISKELSPLPMVFIDTEHLNFIIRNFISNAIKFTPQNGSIHISVAELNDCIKLTVTDTGIGMSDDYLNNIFNIDSNSSRKGTEGEKGTGLGLILCKDFIEKNGGQISVESTKGKGSSFTFILKKHFEPMAKNKYC